MITHDRPVHFEDVDAAGIVFFARFFGYCHDALERFYDGVEGGYVALVTERKIGFPAVHARSDFKAPIRYGDVARIEGTVTKIGTTSVHVRFELTRARDGVAVAIIEHVHVCMDLRTMAKTALPADVRAALGQHLA
jgi:4-hydroxybenzoyl-CoA thioesterase